MSQIDQVLYSIIPAFFAGLGAVISTNQPGNRVAWIFFWISAGGLVDAAAVLPDISRPAAPTFAYIFALAWSNSGFFAILVAPLSLLLFLFPTGRFLTRRWSWGGWVGGLLVLVPLVGSFFANEIGPSTPEQAEWKVRNPIGFIPTDLVDGSGLVAQVFGVCLIALMGGGVASIVVRYRRASPVERAQIKWVAFAGLIFIAWLVASLFSVDLWVDSSLLSNLIFAAVLAFIPLSVTAAIVRYRLFDIDRLISRTVGYAAIVGVLALVYVVGAVWLPTEVLGEQPTSFVAASTLLVAALFNPVRRRVLSWVDRRFHRSSYDAEQVVAAFVGRLQDEVDAETLSEEWISVVTETMQPEAVGVWLQHETQN